MFDKIKDLYNMQKQAKAIKAKLASIHIEAEVDWVTVVMSAEMELISINIPEHLLEPSKKKDLENAIIKAVAKAKKKAEEISAQEMKWVLGSMWLWWLPWM